MNLAEKTTRAKELRAELGSRKGVDWADALFRFMQRYGNANYEEEVTQMEHSLQCAQLAQNECLSEQAVVAALLHDIGHFLVDEKLAFTEFRHMDLNHEEDGADLLADYFPESVTVPIRFHVVAKRYLCSTEPDYYDQLSAASQRSFQLQGGKLSDHEKSELESSPHLPLALALRRIDDRGKIVGFEVTPLEAYRGMVASTLLPDWQ